MDNRLHEHWYLQAKYIIKLTTKEKKINFLFLYRKSKYVKGR